ncbi:tRNA pseudouridine(55) synthase TruB [Anaerostipes sp. 494a]|uniref:tRNA pseudouridine(55) synthase TruB n=1 Tax=Anaerostipes sp. 494a TaxID=1261636 RepID=UPI000951595F|nr:tRNA pseudouridine(55) synthase TruB [Anaerostipes sp. 494a]OLR58386.1 tRNA pseudouridine(55) synthase TruB [Anaerostipes sp. 494a]
MLNGIINVYKEQDFTSHDVVAKLRGILHQRKIGHTGTLDPNATGVLPVCLGRGTKLCDMLTATKKQYKVTFIFGKETDTEDIWGTVTKTFEEKISEDQIEDTILSFVGDYMQIPPMYSAKKIQGKKLYELAREGKTVERKPQLVKIYDICDIVIDYPQVTMTVTCSKGTYIRSLCRDIGYKLHNGACMTELIRTKSSGFSIENSHTLAEIEEIMKNGDIENIIIPVERVFLNYQKATVKKNHYKLLYNGNPLKYSCFHESNIDTGKKIRVYDEEEHFIGIYYWKNNLFFPDKIFYSGE